MSISIKSEIAAKLLQIGAVFLRPNDMFTWASGIKSPIYCDNRITLSYPELRTQIKKAFVTLIKEKFPNVEVIAGVATAGIPQASLVADALELPLIYVRSSSKDHGRTNQIEGILEPGSKIVVIEDLISTGGSSLKAVEALRNSGAEVLGLVAIFTYNLEQAKTNFANARLSHYALSDYETLIATALELKIISKEDLDTLRVWQQSTRP